VSISRLELEPEAAFTIVDQAVSAAAFVNPRLAGLVNAVLRNFQRDRPRLLDFAPESDARLCHPRWWLDRLRRSFPNAWRTIADAGNLHPPMTLRVNRRRAELEHVQAVLTAAGHPTTRNASTLTLDNPAPVMQLPGFQDGHFSVQDAGAQEAAPLLDLMDGQRVLDACAAPGGKAAHILELADVDLLALDRDASRAQLIQDGFARLGLTGEVVAADCMDLPTWWDGRGFDRILADVPCSASGVARRHPDIKWLRRPDDIRRFAQQQARILDALWQTLVPGGKMLYATCSVFDEENRAQVARFRAVHSDAISIPIHGRPEHQLLPNADHDGFYYALLQKQS
jgi:16S rRNA (cytosine967-C5)-methyltransferase